MTNFKLGQILRSMRQVWARIALLARGAHANQDHLQRKHSELARRAGDGNGYSLHGCTFIQRDFLVSARRKGWQGPRLD